MEESRIDLDEEVVGVDGSSDIFCRYNTSLDFNLPRKAFSLVNKPVSSSVVEKLPGTFLRCSGHDFDITF